MKRPRILLVDDERPFLEILEKDLVAEGYDVTTAADGSTGIWTYPGFVESLGLGFLGGFLSFPFVVHR